MGAVLAAAALGAAGSIGGGLLAADGAKDAAPDFNDFPLNISDPSSNVLLNALESDALLGLGIVPDRTFLTRGGPADQLLGSNLAGGVFPGDLVGVRNLMSVLQTIVIGSDTAEEAAGKFQDVANGGWRNLGVSPGAVNSLSAMLGDAGFAGWGQLALAEFEFRKGRENLLERAAELAPIVSAGRDDARRTISGLQSSLVAPTRADIEAEAAEQQQLLEATLLEQANTGGFNPAPNLTLSRNQAISNALGILGGQQNLQTNALSTLIGSLNPNNTGATSTAGLGVQAQTSGGQIAANQALGLAGLQTNAALATAQAQGAGVSGGFASLANALGQVGANQRADARDANTFRLIELLTQSASTPGFNDGRGSVSGIPGAHPAG